MEAHPPVQPATRDDEEVYWTGSSTAVSDDNETSVYRQWFSSLSYMFLLVLLLSSSTLLVSYSSDGTGNYTFFFTTATLSAELLKLLVSLILYTIQRCVYSGRGDSVTPLLLSAKKSMHFAVPAVFSCLNNNLLFLILISIDPATFQLLSHVSIVFVVLFTLLLLRRTLDLVQFISMITLFVGTALTQLDCGAVLSHSKILGLLLIVVYAAMDAFGSVYTERRLKLGVDDSIHVQNIHLFTYGSLSNAILFFIYDFKHVRHSGFFYGYTWITAAIILTFALAGIFSNLIMKYQSTIARTFCISLSVLVTASLSYILLDFKPTLLFLASFIIVVCSIILYRHNDGGLRPPADYDMYTAAARVKEMDMFSEPVADDDPIILSVLGDDPMTIIRSAQGKED